MFAQLSGVWSVQYSFHFMSTFMSISLFTPKNLINNVSLIEPIRA